MPWATSDKIAALALIASISSFVTSILSYKVSSDGYYLAEQSFIQEKRYKAINIQPLITPDIDPNGLSLVFRNVGVGIGRISKIGFGYNGKCINELKDISPDMLTLVANEIHPLITPIADRHLKDKPGYEQNVEIHMPFIALIDVSAQSSTRIFTYSINPLKDKYNRSFDTEAKEIWREFLAKFTVEYKYCDIALENCHTIKNRSTPSRSCLPKD